MSALRGIVLPCGCVIRDIGDGMVIHGLCLLHVDTAEWQDWSAEYDELLPPAVAWEPPDAQADAIEQKT